MRNLAEEEPDALGRVLDDLVGVAPLELDLARRRDELRDGDVGVAAAVVVCGDCRDRGVGQVQSVRQLHVVPVVGATAAPPLGYQSSRSNGTRSSSSDVSKSFAGGSGAAGTPPLGIASTRMQSIGFHRTWSRRGAGRSSCLPNPPSPPSRPASRSSTNSFCSGQLLVLVDERDDGANVFADLLHLDVP